MPFTVDAYAYQPSSGSNAMFNFKEALSASGWKISGSGDGVSTYSENGDILTNGAMLESDGAWFTVVAPDDTRQWSFERKSDNTKWTIKRSKDGMSGSVNHNTPPVDDRAATLVNNETFFRADGSVANWLVSVVSGSTVDNVSSSWYAFDVAAGGGNVYTILYDEPLLSGSYNTLDQDPYVSYANYYSSGFTVSNGVEFDASTNLTIQAGRHIKRVRHNMSSPANQVSHGLYGYGVLGQFTGGVYAYPPHPNSSLNLSPYDGKETIVLASYGRVVASPPTYSGFWGYAANLRWATTLSAPRSNGQTMDAASR